MDPETPFAAYPLRVESLEKRPDGHRALRARVFDKDSRGIELHLRIERVHRNAGPGERISMRLDLRTVIARERRRERRLRPQSTIDLLPKATAK